MPRKPRIDIAGYYHVVNRGVDKRVVFADSEDFEKFEELLCVGADTFGVTIHNYCLMSNHYHLLIELPNNVLSKFMRHLNMNYAIYFNKKHKRAGHLWQGRFSSWYVADETYLNTLMLYIEQNPLKAGIVKQVGEYRYASGYYFLSKDKPPKCLSKAYITTHYIGIKDEIKAFLNTPIDSSELGKLKKASTLIEAPNTKKKPSEEVLKKFLADVTDKKERNKKILEAYMSGYSQHMIAKVLKLAQPTVNSIIKRNRK